MIDVVDVGDRFDGHVVLDSAAVRRFDGNCPFAGFRTQQDDFARLLIVHHQRMRICNNVHRRRLAGADVVDYVALTRVQRERHFGDCAVVRSQQTRAQHEHADNCD